MSESGARSSASVQENRADGLESPTIEEPGDIVHFHVLVGRVLQLVGELERNLLEVFEVEHGGLGPEHVLLHQAAHPPPFLPMIAQKAPGFREQVLSDVVPVVHPEVEDHLDRILAVLGEKKLDALRIHDVDATRQARNVEDEDWAVLVKPILTYLIDLQFQTRVFPDFPKKLPKLGPGILDRGLASS